jgi:hypothetical protein
MIRRVRWTSAPPHQPGSTRSVWMRGGVQVDETFFAWEPDRRIAFAVTAASTRLLAALAEDYEITPLEGGRCRLRWRMGIALRGWARVLHPLVAPSLGRSLSTLLARMERVLATTGTAGR